MVVGGKFVVCNVNVVQPVTYIGISNYSIDLEAQDSYQLQAYPEPSDAENMDVEWYSEDESIATVDQTGKVTALKKGTVRVYVRSVENNSATNYCEVRVLNDVVVCDTIDQFESPNNYEDESEDPKVIKGTNYDTLETCEVTDTKGKVKGVSVSQKNGILTVNADVKLINLSSNWSV